MKYLTRSIKYFFYFSTVTAIMIAILIFIGAVEGDISQIFDGGYSALWKIAIFFAAVAAVYPKVGFITRDIMISGDWAGISTEAVAFFRERGYVLESENDGTVTFRRKGTASRIIKMCEDRITVTAGPGTLSVEGLRKDVMRLAAGLEHRFTPEGE